MARTSKVLRIVASLVILLSPTAAGAQQLLDFEGLRSGIIPQGYGGFAWLGGRGTTSWVVTDPAHAPPGTSRPVSGVNNAWSNGATNLELSLMTGTPFDFFSAFMGGRCDGQVPESQVVHGFRAGLEVFTTTVALSCTTMDQIVFDFLQVDRVAFDQAKPTIINVLIDDIRVGAVTTTPEPASLALFATGLVGVVGVTRRRRSARPK